jgi:glycosyltransferase involved in cell wall biosynthesis
VVIPTYNAVALLMETLDSVFAQTLTDYEVIVVNDGSPDDTARRLEPLAAAGKIRLINQPNGGIGVARNRGLDEARGKYIALLDHDDLWKPEKLRTQVEFMESHPECVGCTARWAASTRPSREACDFGQIIDARGVVVRPMRAVARGRLLMMSSAILYDRERAAGARFEVERKCIEDAPFHLRLFACGPFGVAGDEILMIYRVHATNSSSEPEFFYNGIRLLRRLDREGAFARLQGQDRADLLDQLAHVGRTAWARQVLAGRRWNAFKVLREEFFHQAGAGKWKFLAAAPFLTILSRRLAERLLIGGDDWHAQGEVGRAAGGV